MLGIEKNHVNCLVAGVVILEASKLLDVQDLRKKLMKFLKT